MSLITINVKGNDVKLDEIISLIKNIGETMATQADVDMITAQLVKVEEEVIAARDLQIAAAEALRVEVQMLKDQLAAIGTPLNLDGLVAIAATLDGLNPDTTVV